MVIGLDSYKQMYPEILYRRSSDDLIRYIDTR
jgi:hypothetical protein